STARAAGRARTRAPDRPHRRARPRRRPRGLPALPPVSTRRRGAGRASLAYRLLVGLRGARLLWGGAVGTEPRRLLRLLPAWRAPVLARRHGVGRAGRPGATPRASAGARAARGALGDAARWAGTRRYAGHVSARVARTARRRRRRAPLRARHRRPAAQLRRVGAGGMVLGRAPPHRLRRRRPRPGPHRRARASRAAAPS